MISEPAYQAMVQRIIDLELEITRIDAENKELKASAEYEPLVTVHKDGVQFGKWCWFSHESITGCVAELIPTKRKQYYEWFLKNLREQDRAP